MTTSRELYKCMTCGNIVEVLHAGAGELVCCGAPMQKLQEKTADLGKEKHVPVVERTPIGVTVRVGSVAHPMEEKHYIEWIELIADGVSTRRFLTPGEKAEAEFCVDAATLSARAYCNLHGLWRSA